MVLSCLPVQICLVGHFASLLWKGLELWCIDIWQKVRLGDDASSSPFHLSSWSLVTPRLPVQFIHSHLSLSRLAFLAIRVGLGLLVGAAVLSDACIHFFSG